MTTKTLAQIQAPAFSGKNQVKDLLEKNKDLIGQALPKHMTSERMLRCALTAYTTNPGIKECYIPSLIGGIVQCAIMGLEPNTPLGHAYLIPFKNKKKGRTDVQVIFGYAGLIDLMRRSGEMVSINAGVVREGDVFEFEYGLEEKLRHVPSGGIYGKILYFYAYAILKNGGKQFAVMTKADVDSVMSKTQSGGKYGPWRDYYEEMGKKTAIRRLAKYMPKSIELATAIQMDEAGDAQKPQGLESALTGEYTIEEKIEDRTPIADPYDAGYGSKKDVTGILWDEKIHASTKEGHPVWCDSGEFALKEVTTKVKRTRKPTVKPVEKEALVNTGTGEIVEEAAASEEDGPYAEIPVKLSLAGFETILESVTENDKEECEDLIPNLDIGERGRARKMLKEKFAKKADTVKVSKDRGNEVKENYDEDGIHASYLE